MSLAGFAVPGIVDNADGWGPTTIPEHLEGLPYAPFGKGDKVGRISDFTQTGFNKYGGKHRDVITGLRWILFADALLSCIWVFAKYPASCLSELLGVNRAIWSEPAHRCSVQLLP